MIKSLFLLAFLVSLANAQVDSLKEFLQYYPLETGDYWEYKIDLIDFPFSSDSSFYSLQIMGDTLLSNGHSYKILHNKNIYNDHDSYTIFERVDSSTGCVYRFIDDIDTLSINHERIIDSLFARLGDEITCSREGWSSFGYYKTIFWSMDNDTIFGLPIEKRFLVDQSSIPAVGYAFAKGFGLYYSGVCEGGCSYTSLVYAKISGIEYGDRIIVGLAEHDIAPSAFALSQNYPNPFNPSTTIQFSLPKVSYVTLNIYNTLGQKVAQLISQQMNVGNYTYEWNASGFSSGVYYYRIKAGSFVETKKLVLLR